MSRFSIPPDAGAHGIARWLQLSPKTANQVLGMPSTRYQLRHRATAFRDHRAIAVHLIEDREALFLELPSVNRTAHCLRVRAVVDDRRVPPNCTDHKTRQAISPIFGQQRRSLG